MNNSEKGVTLIALVVTIIVLVIITGVTLNKISSDDGLLNQTANEILYQKDTIENEQKKINEVTKNQLEDWGF